MSNRTATTFDIPRDAAYFVGELFGYYLIPGFSALSFLFNASLARLIIINDVLRKRLKYRLMFSKSFLIGIGGKFHLILY